MTDHLTPAQLARFLAVHPARLWWWRTTPWGESGPPYVRDHGQVRYPADAVTTWVEAHHVPTRNTR